MGQLQDKTNFKIVIFMGQTKEIIGAGRGRHPGQKTPKSKKSLFFQFSMCLCELENQKDA